MHQFYKQTLQLLDTELDRIHVALDRLSHERIWKKGRESTNSIGNLCLHLAGNEYQNVVSAIGNKPFVRERSAEFLAMGSYTSAQLRERLFDVRAQSRQVIEKLTEEDFHREVTIAYPPGAGIASYQKTIMELLYHTASHYSYHTGQIVYMTRILQEGDEHLLRWKH
ncbi:DinB family protein [Brevibacillus nitrificans]|uniref:DinB family protein n=1 Tax=Brevibacillus nitrificans TaxID=651560 RepID=UPI002866374E|nr:DinB family protein [Brevibacillus nitrificans]MDR7315839.1 putative damage-inducible protein DinB [Brevibacillus nitrificans]